MGRAARHFSTGGYPFELFSGLGGDFIKLNDSTSSYGDTKRPAMCRLVVGSNTGGSIAQGGTVEVNVQADWCPWDELWTTSDADMGLCDALCKCSPYSFNQLTPPQGVGIGSNVFNVDVVRNAGNGSFFTIILTNISNAAYAYSANRILTSITFVVPPKKVLTFSQ